MGVRIKNDFYPTPAALTDKLIDTLHGRINPRHRICEPCVGDGAIANRLCGKGFNVVTNDIDTQHLATYHHDAVDPSAEIWREEFYWTVTNPPFKQAFPILKNAWATSYEGVAMLLRITFFEPTQERAAWFNAHADNLRWFGVFGSPRPRFRSGINPKTGKAFGTDSATTAWFVWDKYWSWDALGVDCPFGFVSHWSN